MAEYDGLKPGEVLADASVATFIADLGRGIADAQRQLDENSVNQIAEFVEPREGLGGKSLLDLGLSPAFYHYQHADISCSLQLSLRVQKDLSLGLNLNGSYGSTSTENKSSNESSSETSSGSSSRTSSRTASAKVRASSTGALVVGGRNFSLSGSSPAERIRKLQEALRGDPNTAIERVMASAQPSTLQISTDAPNDKVRVGPNTVAFVGGGFDAAVIRIGENSNTAYVLDGSNTASTTAKANLADYAAHVRDTIAGLGYTVELFGPSAPIYRGFYDIDQDQVTDATDLQKLRAIAMAQQSGGFKLEIEGFTDRPATSEYNEKLGLRRAEGVAHILRSHGVASGSLARVHTRGEKAHEESAGAGTKEAYDQNFRRVDITVPGRSTWWLIVHGDSDDTITTATPDKIGDQSSANGFVAKFNPTGLSLSGKKCTIEGTDFPFRGAAGGGFASGSAEAYAFNLAADINGNQAAGLQANAQGNVVTVMRGGDQYQLTLLTTSSRDISLSGTEGVTVTSQFSRSKSSQLTRQNTGNTSVAFGASLNVGYSRKFDMTITGNSSISARLVSIPAPPQFLETIRDFLQGQD